MEKQVREAVRRGSADKNQLLINFARKINETAQFIMDSEDKDKFSEAEDALTRQIGIIADARDPSDTDNASRYAYAELNYEALNNLARLKNMQGNIEGSLQCLIEAKPHVEEMKHHQMATKRDYVTVLPELCLNISKAANYCNMPNEAR